MHAPNLFPGPKPNHLSPGNPAICFPKKTPVLQNGMVDQEKKTVQNASVCYKNATGMEHGSSHFIVEIYTWIDLVSLVSLLRYMLLRCRDLWHPCFVTFCYAAQISGILASLHVATL